MRIVHLIARLNDGGPARVIAELVAAQRAAGHRVWVLCGACPPDEPDVAERLLPADSLLRIPGLGRRVAPWDDLCALRAIARQLRALRPDILHTHTAKAGALGRLLARWLGLPCLHTYHGHVLSGYWHRAVHAALALLERTLAGTAWHQALTPSQLRELRDRHRIGRRRRWCWLPPPIPLVEPRAAAWHAALPADRPRVLWLARFAPVKDPLLWLHTVAELQHALPVQAVLCGDGALRAAAEAEARRLGLSATWTGFVPAGEALAIADLLLLTSRNEGLPLSAIEAAALGLPVVAPAVGGLADAARWGLLRAAPRTPQALAAACAAALRAPRPAPHPLARALAGPALPARYLALYARIVAAYRAARALSPAASSAPSAS
ncbi:MAG: glycosyltransferase family 4 protein [Planctomycetota bacterium]|nr:glycosyltransferase family 4 protein [Planctomycetota bacterium]MDW8372214.1 glycosyltransferase family 4 protein [Planctomycetota bacterium]